MSVILQKIVNSSTPCGLIILLFDEAAKNTRKSMIYIDQGNIQAAHDHILKTQNIYFYLMRTLNTNIEVTADLYKLYEFIVNELVQANMHKDKERLETVLEMTLDFKATWIEVEKLNNQNNAHNNGFA